MGFTACELFNTRTHTRLQSDFVQRTRNVWFTFQHPSYVARKDLFRLGFGARPNHYVVSLRFHAQIGGWDCATPVRETAGAALPMCLSCEGDSVAPDPAMGPVKEDRLQNLFDKFVSSYRRVRYARARVSPLDCLQV